MTFSMGHVGCGLPRSAASCSRERRASRWIHSASIEMTFGASSGATICPSCGIQGAGGRRLRTLGFAVVAEHRLPVRMGVSRRLPVSVRGVRLDPGLSQLGLPAEFQPSREDVGLDGLSLGVKAAAALLATRGNSCVAEGPRNRRKAYILL